MCPAPGPKLKKAPNTGKSRWPDLSFPVLPPGSSPMKLIKAHGSERRPAGKIGWILLWLLGIPLPILLLIYFFKGG